MRRFFIFSLIFSLVLGCAIAAVVKGNVIDEDGLELPGATVRLVTLPDSTRVGYILSGDSGDFSFANLKPSRYALLLSMTGMDPTTEPVEVKNETDTIDVGTLRMSTSSVLLQEAVVTGIRAAVVAKQDTLEFNAGSFHTNPNASVEDLLKKLPGVEVGSDGSITSGGKTVTKILVDGKEFFADDPKLATKNLPSNMVEIGRASCRERV